MGDGVTGRTAEEVGVKSVLTALDLLDCFSVAEELGVSDLARRLGVAKSTAHRLLTTLCARGITEKNVETGRYRLGLHLYELGQMAIDRVKLRQEAFPLLEELRERTGHSIHLSVPDSADAMYLERLLTLRGIRFLGTVGRRLPSHATSGGKVFAAVDPALAEARLSAGFPPITPYTIRAPGEYERSIDMVRARGYAASFDEFTVGISSVAAPIFGTDGAVRGAVSILDTTDRMRLRSQRTARLVVQAGNVLSRLPGL